MQKGMALSKTQINLGANFVGKGWTALLALVMTPLYLRFLGVESYGLIGCYSGLCAIFSVVDFGMGEAFCRETARFFARNTLHVSVRTLEILYWSLGALLSLTFILLAPWISNYWLHGGYQFDPERVCTILRLMGVAFFFLWPQIFYSKGLLGLQAHLLNNLVLICGSSLRYCGSLAVLLWKPSLEAFFYWQIFSAFAHTACIALSTWNKLPFYRMKVAFSREVFSHFWKFSLGMSAISVTSVLLQQMDKLLISHFFSFEALGYYCFAYTIASSLYYLIQPILSYYYPLFIQCIENQDYSSLKSTYRTVYKLLLCLLAPTALCLIFFGQKIVRLWTSDPHLAETCAPLISLLVVGILLNGFASPSFYLQFAFGHTRPLLTINLFSLALLTPLYGCLVYILGIKGVASFYILLNLGYILFNISYVSRKWALLYG